MKSLARMWRFLEPYKFKMILASLMIIFTAVLTAASPVIEGMATTQLASDVMDIKSGITGAQIQYDVIWKIIVILFFVYIVNAITRMTLQYIVSKSIQSAIYDLRMEVKNKMTQLPVRYFDDHSAGDLMSRMTTDIEVISGTLQQSFSQVITSILGLVFAIIMMFVINWQMALIASSIIPFTFIFSKFIVKRSQKLFEIQQAALGNLNSVTQEKLTGFNEIKLYNYQERAEEEFKEANEKLANNGFKANFFSGFMTLSVTMLTYLVVAISVFIGAIKISQGIIVVGSLQAFIRYIWQINQPLFQTTQLAPAIQSSVASIDRVFEYLDEEEEIKDIKTPVEINNYQGAVSFENVTFGYDETEIIKNVSVDVEPGETIAIVGPTGAGKTTIINLLMRFYDVDKGAIKIDGTNIKDIRRDTLRSLFGMVLQDTWLFSGKIKDNISYGAPQASDEEIIAAARRSRVDHFIMTLPNAYDMELNEESSNISNGEKQLITIARALLSDPKILILDEATSSVDTRLDARIQEAMSELMKGRTSFVIAHRLTTIKNADKILVMDDGNIIEIGNHKELIRKNGFYAELYNSQFSKRKN